VEKSVQQGNSKIFLHISILVIAVIFAYIKIFHAGFIAWDDKEYTIGNADIRAFTAQNMSAWFSRFYIGNYHPLTMLSYAVDYALGGDHPLVYHITNLLLHTVNALMLYLLVNRLQPNRLIGLFVALIFAVNPVQTESVSWIAERKTLLCMLFYLLALLRYTRYVAMPTLKNMLFVVLLGVAAMLSKGVGVALPLSLFAIDIWLKRDLTQKKPWLEKIPLTVISIIIGIVAVNAQASEKALNLHPEYHGLDTIVFAGYAYMQYMIHLLVPYRLSVIYPYPQQIDVFTYLYLLLAAAIVLLAIIAYRRKWYVLCGGIVFFTVNIALVLQFVQFGEVLMADRYLYIACVGVLFPAVYYLYVGLQKLSGSVTPTIVSSAIALVFLVITFIRNDIWLSDFNFYSAILDTFPDSAVAQFSVGGLYMREGNYPEAEKHINLSVQLDPGNYKAWYNKGVLYLREKKPAESLDALNRCLAINEYPKAYFSRAMLYQTTGQPALALADINKVIDDQPQNARAYYIKADCQEQQGDVQDAMDNYNKAITYDSKEPLFYIRRGLAYAKTKQNEPALSDLNTAVNLNPANGEALYFRGVVKYHSGQSPCDDFRAAVDHGYSNAREALAKACGH
jgi:tetratricopeptide (TPR) repeat protein